MCGGAVGHLSLQPVGRGEDSSGGVNGSQLISVGLDPDPGIVHHTQKVIDHLYRHTDKRQHFTDHITIMMYIIW